MDAKKFDRLTQAIGAALSRRSALRAALGTAVLGSLGLSQPDVAEAARCKRAPGPCEICKKGKKTKSGKRKPGKIKPKADQTPCSTTLGSGQCAAGACIVQNAPQPLPPAATCVTLGNPCTQGAPAPGACCSGVCGKRLGQGQPTFCCNNTPATVCNDPTSASQCCNGCDTRTSPPTCACKTGGTPCDDSSQCCGALQCRRNAQNNLTCS
jgi:hypothetical protein